ncbi:organic cation/carnitine transporter 2 [Beta vulgaris subsp. vulgaris]|uniref:organic cation/carnitine transporter 2 n=1 Tax=Beta vulgaris subsp. vulgaris TaxID=3555 RepID=UPI002036F24F|nr:organic cation/carnitine transporter 2 [Beta vulgaris subsp. vulgaris]
MEQNGSKPVEEVEEKNTTPPSMSIDDMIEQSVGRLNVTQILQVLLTTLAPLFDSQQTYISIFAHAQPTWHCTSSNTNSKISCSSSNNSNICRLSKSDWAWDYPNVHTSIISEWDLECASSFITGFPTTCYFVGCLLGGLVLATLGDSSLGRKNLLCVSLLVMSLAALASSFSPNFWVYSIFRFVSGAGRAPVAITALVLQTEKTCKRWRSRLIMMGFINFSLGILLLTAIAYLTKDSSWRNLYLWTSIPGIACSLLCYFFLLESPRWLFMQGRTEDSIAILRKLGSTTSVVYSTLTINNMGALQKGPKETSSFASLKILINEKWAVKRLLASMLLAFGIGLMYFGMFLGVGNLGFNIYLTAALSALLSLLSYLLTFLYWIPRCNRRISMLGFCVISGATSIIFSVLGKHSYQGLIISLEVVSLFCACMAYNLVLMYTVELFPTCVRNSASSLVRQAMIFGSVFDPVLILIGRKNKIYSYGVFGITVLVCGFLVLCLPETRGKVLCDTMEEQELRDNKSSSII